MNTTTNATFVSPVVSPVTGETSSPMGPNVGNGLLEMLYNCDWKKFPFTAVDIDEIVYQYRKAQRLGLKKPCMQKETRVAKAAPKKEGRPKGTTSSRRRSNVDLGQSLKRLSADYCWQLLDRLLTELKDHITVGLHSELRRILRERDVAGYYKLNDFHGLQCMSVGSRPDQGNPAVVRLLISVIRKHEAMSLVSVADRKIRCLESVKTLDASLRSVSADAACDPVYVTMRSLISQLLGSTPDVASIANGSRHGPGSSSVSSFVDRNSYFKFENWPYAVSPTAKALLVDVIKLDQRWVGVLEDSYRERYGIPKWRLLNQESFFENIVHSQHNWNRVTSVPKDGQKDRPIAIEPVGNIYLQLGLGHIIRSRLRSAGLNLDKQQDLNRKAALDASRHRCYFTIDLSNASDTVSMDFVRFVMPPDWFQLLYSLRVPYGMFPNGEGWRYAKFSSMGNGFTFELETLLFWCLSRAISRVYGHRSDVSLVFGDDIIGPAYLYNHHCIYLEASGFQPNLEKSFTSGRAAESCGVDALDGIDIRPVFVKRDPRNVMELYNDRNRLNRWFNTHLGGDLPVSLDKFFLDKIQGELLIGPASDCEFDSYWHEGEWPEGRTFFSLTHRTSERPAKDLRFRKLMHTLRSCDSEGGQFLVAEVSERWAKVVPRVVIGTTGYSCNR